MITLVILALKQTKEFPENPCTLMKEYFGEIEYPEWEEYKVL